eukprot:241854-Lingulodinium_polyedra.AAC.1
MGPRQLVGNVRPSFFAAYRHASGGPDTDLEDWFVQGGGRWALVAQLPLEESSHRSMKESRRAARNWSRSSSRRMDQL